jgi:FkbM family methyltransferase
MVRERFYQCKHLFKKTIFKAIINLVRNYFSVSLYQIYFVSIRANLLKNSTSVLHIGASIGQEAEEYASLGLPVTWVECIPTISEKLRAHLSNFPNQHVIEVLLGEFEGKEVEFFLANNDCMSSSIFKLNKEFSSASKVTQNASLKLRMKRLEEVDLLKSGREFNYWVIDVQGAELGVLKGSGKLLAECKVMEIECSTYPVYDNAPLYHEIVEFLLSNGFAPLLKIPEKFHGNAIFVRVRDHNQFLEAPSVS